MKVILTTLFTLVLSILSRVDLLAQEVNPSAKPIAVVNVTNGLSSSNAKEALSIIEELTPATHSAVILQIHCLMDTNWDEINLIMGGLGQLDIPSYAFVDSMAVDAGALLAFSTDGIYMAPASILGGSPILGGGNAKAKRESFNFATARAVALSKGRDVKLVEAIWNEETEVTWNGEVICEKGDTLMVESQDAVLKDAEGKPFIAEALVSDVYELQKAASLDGPLDFRNAIDPHKLANEMVESLRGKEVSFKGKIVVLEIGKNDLINSARFDYMQRMLERANQEGASAVILDLNTPGGLAWQTGELMMRSLGKLKAPSYAYVNPSAVSAGALIALAADNIYMHPVSAIGAAAVVTPFGDLEPDLEKKVTSVLEPLCRSVARSKGHDPIYATKFMLPEKEGGDEDAAAGDEEILDVKKDNDGSYKVVVKKDNDVGSLLSLAGMEATQPWKGAEPLAKGTANSIEDLIAQEELQGDVIIAEPLGFELLSQWVTRFSAIILLIGFFAAQMELRMPGFGVAGFLSLAMFGLFFFGYYAAGKLVGFELVALFALGVILIILELFVFPGTMVAGIAGFVCILVSLVFTMADKIALPSGETSAWSLDYSTLNGALLNLTGALGGSILAGLLLARFLPESKMFNQLVLQEVSAPSGASIPTLGASSDAVEADNQRLVGAQGVTSTSLRPAGTAIINYQAYDVITDGQYIDEGESVVITTVEGARIVVRPT
jgi:membrane-bound serine protease (ClpP class)